jgi:uncharacterized protein (DUF2461 family)
MDANFHKCTYTEVTSINLHLRMAASIYVHLRKPTIFINVYLWKPTISVNAHLRKLIPFVYAQIWKPISVNAHIRKKLP